MPARVPRRRPGLRRAAAAGVVTALVTAGGTALAPAAVAAPAASLVVDDFAGTSIGVRSVAPTDGPGGATVTFPDATMHVDLPCAAGCATGATVTTWVSWEAAAPVDLTVGGTLDRILISYTGAAPAGPAAVTIGLQVTDATGLVGQSAALVRPGGDGEVAVGLVDGSGTDGWLAPQPDRPAPDLTRVTGLRLDVAGATGGVASSVTVTGLVGGAGAVVEPAPQPATLAPLPALAALVGTTFELEVPAGGHPAPAVTVTGLPDGLSAAATASGTLISGTPTATGTSTVLVTATNGVGSPAQVSTTIVVGSAPGLTAPPAELLRAGTAADVPIGTQGHPAPVVTATGVPAGLTLVQDGGAWALRGTPERSGLGETTVRLTATNGFAVAAAAEIAVTVTGEPELAAPAVSGVLGVALDTTVVATGHPTPTVTVTAPDGGPAATALPDGLRVEVAAGTASLVGTPTRTGAYDLLLTATNALGSDTTPLHLEITQSPTFARSSAELTLREGAATWFALPVVGYPTPSVSVVSGALPSGVRLAADGVLTGVPAAGSADAADGRHDLVVRATNATGSQDLVLSLTILSRAGFAGGPGAVELGVGAPAAHQVVTTGWDRPLVSVLDPLPAGLHLAQVDAATWVLAGMPEPSAVGAHRIRLRADNAFGEPVVRTLPLTVTQYPTFAAADVATTAVEGVPTTVRLPLRGFPHPTVELVGAVPGLSLSHTVGQDPVLTGTPQAGTTGVHELTVRATSTIAGAPAEATSTILLRIEAVAMIGSPPTAVAVAGRPLAHDLLVTGSPAPAVTARGLPAGVRLEQHAGVWSLRGAPEPGTGGVHEIRLTATNGVLESAGRTVHLTVREGPTLSVTVPALREAQPGTVALRAVAGFPRATLRIEGRLPDGLRFIDGGDGTARLTGTPGRGSAGSWRLTAVADNGSGPATRVPVTLAITRADGSSVATTTSTGTGRDAASGGPAGSSENRAAGIGSRRDGPQRSGAGSSPARTDAEAIGVATGRTPSGDRPAARAPTGSETADDATGPVAGTGPGDGGPAAATPRTNLTGGVPSVPPWMSLAVLAVLLGGVVAGFWRSPPSRT